MTASGRLTVIAWQKESNRDFVSFAEDAPSIVEIARRSTLQAPRLSCCDVKTKRSLLQLCRNRIPGPFFIPNHRENPPAFPIKIKLKIFTPRSITLPDTEPS